VPKKKVRQTRLLHKLHKWLSPSPLSHLAWVWAGAHSAQGEANAAWPGLSSFSFSTLVLFSAAPPSLPISARAPPPSALQVRPGRMPTSHQSGEHGLKITHIITELLRNRKTSLQSTFASCCVCLCSFSTSFLLGNKNKIEWGRERKADLTKLSFLVKSINICANPSARAQKLKALVNVTLILWFLVRK
jgi:hypothetical protein